MEVEVGQKTILDSCLNLGMGVRPEARSSDCWARGFSSFFLLCHLIHSLWWFSSLVMLFPLPFFPLVPQHAKNL